MFLIRQVYVPNAQDPMVRSKSDNIEKIIARAVLTLNK